MADNNNELTPQQLAEACAAAMNERDLAVRHLGIKILRVAPGAADLQMTISEIMIQGHASCHGGYLFTRADSAFAYACNSYDDVCVALGCSIDYIAPGRLGDVLTARATEVSRSGRTGNYRFTITEGASGSVQYRVTASDAYPAIDITSQVLDIISGESGAVVDNSKLLL